MRLRGAQLLAALMLAIVEDVVCQFIYPPAATTDNPVDVSGIVVATGTSMTIRWSFPSSFLQANSNFSLRVFQGPVNGIWKYDTLIGRLTHFLYLSVNM
jgi:hypothetical protein